MVRCSVISILKWLMLKLMNCDSLDKLRSTTVQDRLETRSVAVLVSFEKHFAGLN